MNTDSAFCVGKTHPVCQDYVINGHVSPDLNYVILADGCSSSLHTDIGARNLCHLTKSLLPSFLSPETNSIDIKEFAILKPVNLLSGLLDIEDECLDATLISAVGCKDKVTIDFFGDGILVLKEAKGNTRVISFNYSDNYPYYINYQSPTITASQRLKNWRNKKQEYNYCISLFNEDMLFVENRDNDICSIFPTTDVSSAVYLEKEHSRFIVDTSLYTFIAIMSDGVHSFYKINMIGSMEAISYIDIVKRLISFKNFKGKFVQRRLNKFKKKCQETKIYHHDDVSLGAIYLGD